MRGMVERAGSQECDENSDDEAGEYPGDDWRTGEIFHSTRYTLPRRRGRFLQLCHEVLGANVSFADECVSHWRLAE